MFTKTLIGAAVASAISAASFAGIPHRCLCSRPHPKWMGEPASGLGDYGGTNGGGSDNWEGNSWRGDAAPAYYAGSPSQVTLVNGGRYYGRGYGGGYGGGYYGRGYGGYGGGYFGRGYGGGYGGGYYGQGYGGDYARGYYGGEVTTAADTVAATTVAATATATTAAAATTVVAGTMRLRPYYAPSYGSRIAYCQARFRTYDVYTRTYMGYDGRRHYC